MGIVTPILGLFTLLVVYIYTNDRKLRSVPPSAAKARQPWTDEDIQQLQEKSDAELEVDLKKYLGEKTGRRYIIVGGAGFFGGWLILHLLERGERAENIRILDIRQPERPDIRSLLETTPVSFVKTDITNPDSVRAAFNTPWPDSADTMAEITVFHAAASIRFYDSDKRLLSLSTNVNVDGTKNVLDSAKEAGNVTIFISTSSGSVGIRGTRLLLWPWESQPKYQVQRIDDAPNTNGILPASYSEFCGNYSYSKLLGEKLVLDADMSVTSSGKLLRTGCLRPSNAVYGPGGDIAVCLYVDLKMNPMWDHQTVSSFIYIENCSIGHLAYERTLLANGLSNKGFGGRSYCITDGGPPPAYGDIFKMINTGTNGEVKFPKISPTFMILFAHIVECIYLAKRFLPSPLSLLVPSLPSTLAMMQPAIFPLTLVHSIFDDSRARKEIGYRTPWTSQTGVWESVRAKLLKEEGKGYKVVRKGVIPLGGVPVPKAAAKLADTVGL